VEYRSKPAGGLDAADQACHFEVGGQPCDYAASFSIEFESSP
jgi:hypothetical protein